MPVIAFDQRNPLSAVETLVQAAHFADSLARAFNGEEIEHRRGHHYRPRIHHQQQPRMVHTVCNHSVKVLLGIAVRILEDAVIDPHGKRSNVTGRCGNFNSRIKRGNVRGLKSTAAGAGNVDTLRINFGPGQ